MSFNCPLSNENLFANVGKIKDVLKQICLEVRHLLQNVTYNLKANGINYNALQFQKVVIRIITPFQILSQLHVVDNQSLFATKQSFPTLDSLYNTMPLSSNSMRQIKKQQAQKSLNQTSFAMRNPQNRWLNVQVKGQRLYEEQRSRKYFNKQDQNKVQNKQVQKKFNTNLNRVDFEMEQIVYDWIRNLQQTGVRIQMVDICRYARSVSKNQAFQASSGWCANFLNRHPDIKDYVKNCKKLKPLPQNLPNSADDKFILQNKLSQKLTGHSYYQEQTHNYPKIAFPNKDLPRRNTNSNNFYDLSEIRRMKNNLYEQEQQQQSQAKMAGFKQKEEQYDEEQESQEQQKSAEKHKNVK